MNKRQLTNLGLIACVLLVVFFVLQSDTPTKQLRRTLFSNIDGSKLAKVVLQQGETELALKLVDGNWVLPGRENYPADEEKVRSLFVRMLDLEASQSIPATENTFDALGVTDAAVKQGRGKISLFDAAENLLGELYLGENRKKESGMNASMPAFGQYVRRGNEQQVYLLGQPFSISVSFADWIRAVIANVLASDVRRVEQFSVSADGSRESVFALVPPKNSDSAEAGTTLVPTFSLPAGEELVTTVLSQTQSGLENLRISDVFQADGERVKDLKFDQEAVYWIKDGLRYAVQTAQRDNTTFGRLSVTFDEDFANQLKAQHAAMQGQESENQSGSDSSSSSGAAVKVALVLSDAAKASELQKRYAPWVYEFANYQGVKFRQKKADLTQKNS